VQHPKTLQKACFEALMCAEPARKSRLVEALVRSFEAEELDWRRHCAAQRIEVPGRPGRPELVHPKQVPRRRLGNPEGRKALIHAVAHIEFNAINLALDAVYRFAGMPRAFYSDWLGVAADESRHFSLLEQRLGELGADYGDYPAHNGLWEMALKTDADCLERMALVPRVLEARGLDVTPGMIERLQGAGDHATVSVLRIILEEEVGHVEIGSRWFRWCCDRQGVDPESTFKNLLQTHYQGRIQRPFNYTARQAAGFSASELAHLEALSQK
jgi:uncharacterized ferritin-like protein (DUF455 family)